MIEIEVVNGRGKKSGNGEKSRIKKANIGDTIR